MVTLSIDCLYSALDAGLSLSKVYEIAANSTIVDSDSPEAPASVQYLATVPAPSSTESTEAPTVRPGK